jgi:hypothetical protein
MRPRADTSGEPISCAGVEVGLIEVSPSLFKPGTAVKLPSVARPLSLSPVSFQRAGAALSGPNR